MYAMICGMDKLLLFKLKFPSLVSVLLFVKLVNYLGNMISLHGVTS